MRAAHTGYRHCRWNGSVRDRRPDRALVATCHGVPCTAAVAAPEALAVAAADDSQQCIRHASAFVAAAVPHRQFLGSQAAAKKEFIGSL